MKNTFADLHVHTSFSDGSFSPAEAVRHAAAIGLAAISVTDHDITDGMPQALSEGAAAGVEVIPGVELSAEFGGSGENEMHILGYFIDWENAGFQGSLRSFREHRKRRADEILDRLAGQGVHLNREKLLTLTQGGAIGRLHFAKALVLHGAVKDIGSAFNKYLGHGKPAYVPKMKLSPEEAIAMILKVGGVPVLAHPHYGNFADPEILRGLIDAGLQGLEVWHSKHPQWAVKKYKEIADEAGLVATGGSDCHGIFEGQTPSMGKIRVPYEVVDALKKRRPADRPASPGPAGSGFARGIL